MVQLSEPYVAIWKYRSLDYTELGQQSKVSASQYTLGLS